MANPILLRPYQLDSVEALREGMRAGHRAQVLMAPTGAGKTEIGAYLCDEVNKKARRAAFVVDRVNLVDQTSQRFDHYGIPHGVIQADHWRRRGYERIQICSAQTIEKRGFFPDLDLLIVDECHATRQATTQLIQNRAGLRVVGLSATPFTKGLGAVYSNLVNVTTTNELIEGGWLVPLQVYAARAVDMTGAKVVAGEWSEREIEKRGMEIVGDIVAEWIDKTRLHFGGPVKTIVFSATVEHGNELCRQFNEAGYNFQQISYKDADGDRRRELIEEFRKPDSEIVGLVSCEVFTKGFDVPDIRCGIGARPYRKSLSSHIQQLGRVMRLAPDKAFGLWLDHCGNVLRFGEDTARIFAHGLDSLNDGSLDAKSRPEPSDEERKQLRCVCGFVLPPNCTAWPHRSSVLWRSDAGRGGESIGHCDAWRCRRCVRVGCRRLGERPGRRGATGERTGAVFAGRCRSAGPGGRVDGRRAGGDCRAAAPVRARAAGRDAHDLSAVVATRRGGRAVERAGPVR
ncbi:DEAD/DEAH box helicase [Burkholderia glumae]